MRCALNLPISILAFGSSLIGCGEGQNRTVGFDTAPQIVVKADGANCVVQERSMPCSGAITYLREELKLPAGSDVHVKADPGASYESVAKVLNELQRSEFMKSIAFIIPADPSTRFSVVITAIDQEWKVRAIKAIREETGLGLAAAKNLVESTPGIVKSALTESDAEATAIRLRAQRMTVEIRRDP
jgi:ribosomal protein L7/L12